MATHQFLVTIDTEDASFRVLDVNTGLNSNLLMKDFSKITIERIDPANEIVSLVKKEGDVG